MFHLFTKLLLPLVLVHLFVQTGWTLETEEVDQKRNRLIGYMISRQLPVMHFSDKVVDDRLAIAAFGIYIKQLDFQKRFLLQQDVEQLQQFATFIDDNLHRGTISLPDTGFTILNERIAQVEAMVLELLDETIDPSRPAFFETDPEKLQYAATLEELQERWRNILQWQITNRYLDLEEEHEAAGEERSEEELWRETYDKVAKQNRNFFNRLHQETLQDHYDRFFLSVTKAFDPHTNYIPPAGKEQFDIDMRGSLEGIGAMLREEDGLIKVVKIIPGSASARQGRLEAEDVILQVAEGGDEPVDITDMRLRDAVRLIRGPKGTEVRLTVRKSDGVKEVIPIIRDVVQIEETFVRSLIVDGPNGERLGYLLIPSFYRDFARNGSQGGRNSSDDTRAELAKLKEQGIDGLILDLRDNSGGALVDAVEITGMFIDYGPVVQVKNSGGAKRIMSDEQPGVVYDGPLVVMVNKFSASASEIVAAALQDYGRAVVVGGAHTHGKGTVQTIVDLNENIPLLQLRKYEDLGALKVMIQKFYRVTGGSTQYKGVEPDIVLPSMLQYLESGERYLEYSLPWDQIEAIEFTPWQHNLPVAELRELSQQRVAADEGFQTIEREAAAAEKRSQETFISLRLADVRAKRLEAKQARDNISRYLSRYRGDDGTEAEGQERDDSPEGLREEWRNEVQKDPYVREAGRVLADIFRLQ